MAENDLLQICRSCLAENVSFRSIFTSDENSGLRIHFAEMIMACASVQVNRLGIERTFQNVAFVISR